MNSHAWPTICVRVQAGVQRPDRIATTRDAMPIAHDPPLPLRNVITAFVWDGRRVLLARRSHKVSTFPGHWAAISGYLEGADPRLWAQVEIAEECGVDRKHLTLRGAAAPLTAEDPRYGAFRVHPFLFWIDQPEGVRSDWEAAQFEWVEVEDFRLGRHQPMVPRLLDAFQAVWPPWDADQSLVENRRLAADWLRSDRALGAGSLARAAAGELAKLARLAGETDDFRRREPVLRAAIRELSQVRKTMAAPANLLADIANQPGAWVSAWRLMLAIDRQLESSREAEKETARRVAVRLKDFRRPMTISYSGTVAAALKLIAARLERVFVCESRPLMEGRRLATELASAGVQVTLITDAAAVSAMSEADCVLLGADAMLCSGDVVNKTGSTLLALAARRHNRPVFVAADRLKWERSPGSVVPTESNAPDEVWSDPPAGISVVNPYFDRVPADLINEVISEEREIAT